VEGMRTISIHVLKDMLSGLMASTPEPCDYSSNKTPAGYECGECGATGCKLWREYQTFLNHQTLCCGDCALKNQDKEGPIDEDGRRLSHHGMKTDQIGWRIPAVPTEENDTYWGYSSVPQAGVDWWRRLPLTTKRK
jgi:hypothetical protein